MMIVAHNLMAMNAQRQFGLVGNKKSKSAEKLSSGYKVNRAADNAAGLAISEKMRWAIKGLEQGRKNIRDGISVCQIMDSAMNEISDIMNRMTQLSVQAANDTLDDTDRRAIQAEIDELTKELDRTSSSAQFNEKPLLNNIEGVKMADPSASGPIDVIFVIDNTGSMGGLINNVRNNMISFADTMAGHDVRYGIVQYGDISEEEAGCFPFTTDPSQAKANVGNIYAHGGGDGPESALEGIMDSLGNYSFRSGATREMILVTDADYHYKGDGSASRYTTDEVKQALADKNVTLTVATNSGYRNIYKDVLTDEDILDISGNFSEGLCNIGKNAASRAGEKYIISPDDIEIQMSSTPGDRYTIRVYNVSAENLGLNGLSVLTQEDAGNAIDSVKKAMHRVSEIRSQIGADQNALEHSYNVNYNVEENTIAAESQIRDTDMAKEMLEYSNQKVLEQAGVSMISQANQLNQNVLSLLS